MSRPLLVTDATGFIGSNVVLRYATDIRKVQGEPGWLPVQDFESGLRRTVERQG
ncbi:hypothetical protein [Terriglobus sp. RCC_193]|uniref:hypothetical protein n=1 Tax=Terriglobus sp. RCC_193 TaxID=3239218 RepID=UPI003523C45B